ncbi:hypothetical protein SEA_EYES_30 [Gordonia phage Eyes]|nr:hypothetical protein SEA_EYES_30 [Gordonia phage Eyes]
MTDDCPMATVSRRQRARLRRRLRYTAIAGAVVVAIGAFFVAGYVTDESRQKAIPETTYSLAPPSPLPAPVRMAVIGDSMSKGTPQNKMVWPEIVAEARGWKLTNAAGGGGGYVNGVARNRAFRNQINAALERLPKVIVVAGSRNDRNADPAEVQRQATELLTTIRTRAPQAKVVVVGPIWDYNTPTPQVRAVNDAVRAAAVGANAQFLDALGENWLPTRDLVQADSTHPTDAGQQAIADRMNRVLPQIQPAVPSGS